MSKVIDPNAAFAVEKNRMVSFYTQLSKQAAELQKTDIPGAANVQIRIASLLAEYLRQWSQNLSLNEVNYLKIECVARAFQCLLLRSVNLSGFVDLSINMSNQKRLLDDVNIMMNSGSCGGGALGENKDLANVETIVSFIPWSTNKDRLENMIGYKQECQRLMQAYYIVRGNARERHSGEPPRATVTVEHSNFGSNVILYGPPGTGKTSTARAAAGSLGIDCYFVNAENLLSAYRSETEKNLSQVYEYLRKSVKTNGRNALLLLDEVDGLVKSRSQSLSGGEYSLLTKFLTILEPIDGSDNSGIMSVFTTNRLDNLDPAFIRRCTPIYMGYIESREDRMKLIEYFYNDITIWENKERDLRTAAELTIDWVPGDHVRFIKDVLDVVRMNAYLTYNKMSADNFWAKVRETSSTNRLVYVDLPSLSSSILLEKMSLFSPTTPRNV